MYIPLGQFRKRELYADCKSDGNYFTKEDCFSDKWFRADGDCVCQLCGHKYKDHPLLHIVGCSEFFLSGDHVLCDDSIVHI